MGRARKLFWGISVFAAHRLAERVRRFWVRTAEPTLRLFRLVLGLGGATALAFIVPHYAGYESTVITSIREALFTATVLTAIVDPYIKTSLAADIRNRTFWALVNPDAPAEQKQAVEHLARQQIVYDKAVWTINVGWENKRDKIVWLDVTVNISGRNFDRAGYR